MLPDSALKDYLRESRLINHRAMVALAGALFMTGLLVLRLVYLQVVAHEHFTTLSRDNRVKLVASPPTRGLIYDRNGVLLAENLPSFQLEAVAEQVDNLPATVERLRHLIPIGDDDIQRFYRILARTPRFESVPLRFNLSEEEVARFAVNRQQFPGVDIEARLRRHYPLGPLGAHVLGYVGRIDVDELQQVDASNYRNTNYIGKVGVEKYYEDVLHGSVGVQQVEINAQGRALRVLDETPSVPGKNLYLTIDAQIEARAQEALGDYNGAIVALDPRTGEVLALVSKPGYDPNLFVGGLDPASYAALQRSPDQPLFNRALRGRYPPGSTLKPFVALAGLQYQVVTPADATYCPGWYRLKGNDHKYRCWRRTGHGRVDMDRALVESCDVYFYNLALALGIDRLSAVLGEFGLGSTTGVDLSGELPGLLPTRDWKRAAKGAAWFPGETLITGIGQGYLQVTPLQLAAAMASVASHGLRLQPHVLYATQDERGGPLDLASPRVLGTIPMSRTSYWDDVIASLTRVVNSSRGTARGIGHDAPYLIAGKTGTSQVFGLRPDEKYHKDEVPLELRDHALFIAFAPVKDPRIAVAVVAEHGGSGGATAAPIARQVLDAYLEGAR